VTLIIASKNFQVADSPRLVVTNRKETQSREKEKLIYEVGVIVKNYGNGVALRTYLMAETVDGQFHLSKPTKTLTTDQTEEIKLNIRSRKNVKKAYVLTQDFFNNIYFLHFDYNFFNNSHLNTFVSPVKKTMKYGLKFWQLKFFMWRARNQRNTYPDQVRREAEETIKRIEEEFNIKPQIKKIKGGDE
jgi:hypothetical protein